MGIREIRGRVATVRWGYRPVATVTEWTFMPTPDGGTFEGTAGSVDAFGVTQDGLSLVAPAGRGRWTWPVKALTVDGTLLRLVVGRMEED
jgi:hypothetical protein